MLVIHSCAFQRIGFGSESAEGCHAYEYYVHKAEWRISYFCFHSAVSLIVVNKIVITFKPMGVGLAYANLDYPTGVFFGEEIKPIFMAV